jgi:thymidylate synthase
MVATELLWMLSGSTNNEDLRKLNGNDKDTIWEEWAGEDGELGPIYGSQWRNWGKTGCDSGIDQIADLITGLKERPFSRRHIVSAWNVADLPDETLSPYDNVCNFQMALAPCHAFFQFYVRKLSFEERIELCDDCSYSTIMHQEEYSNIMNGLGIPKFGLSCHLYARSQDTILGTPYNISSYALLTHMIANVVNMIPDNLHMSFGDSHIYKNHIEQAHELLSRDLELYSLPTLEIDKKYSSIDDFTMESFKILNYQSHPRIYAPISI